VRNTPVYEPTLTPEDVRAVSVALAEGLISGSAPPVRKLEAAYAERCAMPHGVAVSNGTAALELAVAALNLGPGDEVLCPAFTIISCARAIVLAGATPVLVDVDPGTWCLDVRAAEARVSSRTRAVLGVHAFGHPYDHAALAALAEQRDLLVIEDAAQAHGARVLAPNGALECGGLGDVSTFSFYANKAVTTGEGGMLLTKSRSVAERVRDLSNLFMKADRRFLHEELGHNYRLSSLQAALGLSQLARLEETLAIKRRIAASYRERLALIDEVGCQTIAVGVEPIHWMNCVVLSDALPADAAEVTAALARRGVETRPLFVGLHEQPALIGRGLFHGEGYPVTEKLSRRGFYLPSGLSLDETAIDEIVQELRGALVEVASRRVFMARSSASGAFGAAEAPLADAQPVFGDAFAAAYDALYGSKDYAAEVDRLGRCFERFSAAPVRRLLDLGCGTGRHVREARLRGYEVVGVDRSSAMLTVARGRMPEARFVVSDMCTLELGETFDAVVILFAALCYQTTPEAILAALASARRHLEVGGLLVADVWLGQSGGGRDAPTVRRAETAGVRWQRTGWLKRDPLAQRVDVTYELRKTSAGGEILATETHRMHYFSPFELDFALRASGFRLVHLSKEQDLDKAPASNDLTALFVAEAC
jgi:perosamine synthetase